MCVAQVALVSFNNFLRFIKGCGNHKNSGGNGCNFTPNMIEEIMKADS